MRGRLESGRSARGRRPGGLRPLLAVLVTWVVVVVSASAQTISGVVSDDSDGLSGVRVTLYNADLSVFIETRSASDGSYSIVAPTMGLHTVGFALRGMRYTDTTFTIGGNTVVDRVLGPETDPGQWQVIMNAPEPLGGTDLAVLLRDDRIFYCHNTVDPFYFDPAMNNVVACPGAASIQGCVGPVPVPSGRVVFFGGTNQEVYGPGTRLVKSFDPVAGQWQAMGLMLDYRWYPTTIKLPDERVLIAGGGNQNNPQRTRSSEVYDPATGTSQWTDSLALGNEVSPIVVLHDGRVLMTHRPPQLFDPSTNQWELTGDFVQGPRMPNGDHADHQLILMPDGEVVAIGYMSFSPPAYGRLVEVYDPNLGTWSLREPHDPVRSRPNLVLLPDERILVTGGRKEDPADPQFVNTWGYMRLAELYEPATDTWRRVADMNWAREYHSVPLLVPDGRVIMAGGEGAPGNEPPFSVIEAYSPPYLFRGPRPAIIGPVSGAMRTGTSITFTVAYADSITSVVLLSRGAVTHFMHSDANRALRLPFAQSGMQITAQLPADSVLLMSGDYMLFAMVDDIPSIAASVTIGQDITTGLEADRQNVLGLSLHPNPVAAGQVITAIRSAIGEDATLRVFDAVGRQLLTRQWSSGSSALPIQLPAQLPTGTYLVHVYTERGAVSRPFVLLAP